MENQHRKIAGYRELSQDEIDCMNKVKVLGEELGKLYDYLLTTNAGTGGAGTRLICAGSMRDELICRKVSLVGFAQ